jgi:hypothetical protein
MCGGKVRLNPDDKDDMRLVDCPDCATATSIVVVDPEVKRDSDYCSHAGCSEFARPRDELCNTHRRLNPGKPKSKGHTHSLTHRIKGLDGLKLK